jgi:uncharacterized protein (DUF4415 family)
MSESDSNPTSGTDWARVTAMTDAEIDTSDSPPLGEEFFQRARLRRPSPEALVEVTLHLDPEVLKWFQQEKSEFEREINAALRIYAEAHSQYRSPRRKTA